MKLLITDLDNTLYDWVGAQVPAFNAMLANLVEQTRIPEQELLLSFKQVHQRYRTSEYAMGLVELDALDSFDGGLSPVDRAVEYKSALEAFYATRRSNLHLYGGVRSTLETLRSRGIRVVAHTDAMMHYASHRVSVLGLEPLLDGLFAPEDHSFPEDVIPFDVGEFTDPDRFRSRVRIQEELPHNLMKPNPKVLTRILDRMDTSPSEALYVGDSLTRDIRTAQLAGVNDVLASYGPSYESSFYSRLVEVTHWTEEDVEQETQLKRFAVTPTWTIDEFSGLIDIFEELATIEKSAGDAISGDHLGPASSAA